MPNEEGVANGSHFKSPGFPGPGDNVEVSVSARTRSRSKEDSIPCSGGPELLKDGVRDNCETLFTAKGSVNEETDASQPREMPGL